MSREKSTIPSTGLRSDHGVLRLAHMPGQMLHERHTPSQTAPLHAGDPRWVFAVLVRLEIERGTLTGAIHDRLMHSGERMGLGPMQAQALFAITQESLARGGFDSSTRADILSVPAPCTRDPSELSDRTRWMVFGALFCWALMIAGLMLIVA